MNKALPARVPAVLLIGPTGAGKSPLGDHLALHGFLGRRCHHLDFGSELRSLAASRGSRHPFSPDELEFVRGVLSQGFLLENEHFPFARKIVLSFLERQGFHSGDVLLLNGIPRHIGQARDLSSFIAVHALIVLDCAAETVSLRLQSNIGGDRHGRHDDGDDLVAWKLLLFNERTAPLLEHYEDIGATIYRIDVSGRTTVVDVFARLSLLSATDPPVPFVAEPPER